MFYLNIKIVLLETSHPGNIGSTARAMKNMGFTDLCLVKPALFPHIKANELAAGADDILDNATVVDTLAEAIADCQLILGTSARPRGISLPGLTPRTCAEKVNEVINHTKVAILFGREYAGLTNEELLTCHYHITIPANPHYSSLNLSQAVQVITYELRQALVSSEESSEHIKDTIASRDAIEKFYVHLKDVLIQIGFLKLTHPRRLMERVTRMFNRIQLESMEVNLLRGMLTQIQKNIHHKEPNHEP